MKKVLIASIFSISLLSITTANAAEKETNADWTVFAEQNACWMASKPISNMNEIGGDNEAFFSVQNDSNEDEAIKHSIAIQAPFEDAYTAKAILSIDGNEFKTLIYKDNAFIGAGNATINAINAMKKGKEMTITWEKDDKKSTQTYSLNGFTKSITSIDSLCK